MEISLTTRFQELPPRLFLPLGGLYPLEIFLLSGKDTVTGLPAGVHQYKPATNSLETISSGDSRASLAQAALGQMWLARAPAIIVIAAAFERTTSRYGLEVAHVMY